MRRPGRAVTFRLAAPRSGSLLCALCALGLLATLSAGCADREGTARERVAAITARTLGLAYLEENRLPEAEEELRRVIALVPREALGYADLGLVYLRLGRYEEADAELGRALDIAPNDPDIRLILAKNQELAAHLSEAIRTLEGTLARTPAHVRTLYTLSELLARDGGEDASARRAEYLGRAVVADPGNVALRLHLIEALLRGGESDSAAAQLEALAGQLGEMARQTREAYDEALRLARAGDAEAALPAALALHNLLRPIPLYQAGIIDLEGPGGASIGFPIRTFSEAFSARAEREGAPLAALRFTDMGAEAGLDVLRASPVEADAALEWGLSLAAADYDGDGDVDLLLTRSSPDASQTPVLLRNDAGRFAEATAEAGLANAGVSGAAAFADYDNDGDLDLYLALASRSPGQLFRNRGGGMFQEVTDLAGLAREAEPGTAVAGPGEAPVELAALFADLDHEGDLDLFVARRESDRLHRNNGDGTFLELAARAGVAGGETASRDAAFGDFDDDADLDLLAAGDAGLVLYANLRQGRFADVTEASGLAISVGVAALAVGDYDNDGFLDIFATSTAGAGRHLLYTNRGDGTFEPDRRSAGSLRSLSAFRGLDAAFLDFDNDGHLDLAVAGMPGKSDGPGVRLLRNDGTGSFTDASPLLPSGLGAARRLATADHDGDGDLDIFTAGLDGSVHLLRNDGGDANRYLAVRLVGLSTGSGKNNHFGIGAKLELRAGDLYQTRVVTEPLTHFGLGARSAADVVRVTWTNGVPQNSFTPPADHTLVEEQALKGSCAFLYAWDGASYSFVTDIMWRSAIGMPLGIMAGSTAYAPPDASREHLRIPGEMLRERDGLYSLQITEELWETAYLDELKLVVLDHPDSIELYVDERFVPPDIPFFDLHQVAETHPPVSATDGEGRDLLPQLRERDALYVSALEADRYQGITRLHDLILDLGPFASDEPVRLFLQGWIFPTDASINVALAQSAATKLVRPHLQVVDRQGHWLTAIEEMGFPTGKEKTVVVDLSGSFPTDDHRVRIRTSMQIYWDRAFVSVGTVRAPIRRTTLEPVAAHLHFRGFSREFRKGGRYGPQWFDYGDVSTEPRWRPMEGRYTRYGDVQPLLRAADDRYVVLAAGDEMTVEFDATQAPPLEPGWRRDFLLYSDGWLKDADLNTAEGGTVEPLPFHAMSRYPYGADEAYPADEAHRRYLEAYHTRFLGRRHRPAEGG
ncbi:MAG: FG-GAP-like repeat-containing protein [Gemmatimonadota bacterium]